MVVAARFLQLFKKNSFRVFHFSIVNIEMLPYMNLEHMSSAFPCRLNSSCLSAVVYRFSYYIYKL